MHQPLPREAQLTLEIGCAVLLTVLPIFEQVPVHVAAAEEEHVTVVGDDAVDEPCRVRHAHCASASLGATM